MKVMMLILESEDDFAHRTAQTPAAAAYWEAWKTYSAAVNDKTVGGNILGHGKTAATIRIRNGERTVQDGPFADSKESLGGYMIFEVENMEEAMELAATCPAAATGAVELRPIVPMQEN